MKSEICGVLGQSPESRSAEREIPPPSQGVGARPDPRSAERGIPPAAREVKAEQCRAAVNVKLIPPPHGKLHCTVLTVSKASATVLSFFCERNLTKKTFIGLSP